MRKRCPPHRPVVVRVTDGDRELDRYAYCHWCGARVPVPEAAPC